MRRTIENHDNRNIIIMGIWIEEWVSDDDDNGYSLQVDSSMWVAEF